MKKFFLLSVAATLTCSISFAKIWRVNNNFGVTADFTTAQLANDNASVVAGDTIHLEPSITDYGSLTCTKRLTWISTGAFLDIHPNLQFSTNVGKITGITATVAGAANSVFHVYASSLTLYSPGIRVDRCYISGSLAIDAYAGYGSGNMVIINSFIGTSLTVNTGGNHVITNNIVGNNLSVGANTTLAVFTNNVFNAISGSVGTVNNSIVENNIFNKATTAYTFTNSTVQYNMSGAAAVLPAGNNNQNNVAMANVFVNNFGSDDASFVLKAGSPAIAAGSSGVDLGAYGGASPFKIALQPAIPAIYNISAPEATAGNTLNVTFSTKSNN